METTMESGTKTRLTKLAVRLIGIYFFAWAVRDSYELLLGIKESKNFFGFHVSLGGQNWDFFAWVQVIALVLIGFQLLRIHPSGRFWALAVLWMYALEAGGFLIWLTFKSVQAFYRGEPVVSHVSTWFGELNGPVAFLLLLLGAFVIFFIQAYFLMRRDVKQLFQQPAITGGVILASIDSKEQSS